MKIKSIFLILILIVGLVYCVSNETRVYADGNIVIPFVEKPNVLIDGVIGKDEYPFQYVDPNNQMIVVWMHDLRYIYIGIEAPGTGWIGIGMGSYSMDGSNIIIGYVDDETGETVLSDETGIGHEHEPDVGLGGTNDIVSYAGSQEDGFTTIEFVFPLKPDDKWDPKIEFGTDIPVILAYHPSADDTFSYHGATYSVIKAFVEGPSVLPTILNIETGGSEFRLGEPIDINISLRSIDGRPVSNALIHIYTTTILKDAGFIEISQAKTDSEGIAKTSITYNSPGNFTIMARFEGGGEGYQPSESNIIDLTIIAPYKEWIVNPEDPYYNWGWIILNLPHRMHGTPDLEISPTTLIVMLPLFSIILGVWLTYAYVYSIIIRIKGVRK